MGHRATWFGHRSRRRRINSSKGIGSKESNPESCRRRPTFHATGIASVSGEQTPSPPATAQSEEDAQPRAQVYRQSRLQPHVGQHVMSCLLRVQRRILSGPRCLVGPKRLGSHPPRLARRNRRDFGWSRRQLGRRNLLLLRLGISLDRGRCVQDWRRHAILPRRCSAGAVDRGGSRGGLVCECGIICQPTTVYIGGPPMLADCLAVFARGMDRWPLTLVSGAHFLFVETCRSHRDRHPHIRCRHQHLCYQHGFHGPFRMACSVMSVL